MSLQDLPKTIANTALGLIRLPLELLERVIPGRGGDHRAERPGPMEPDPGASEPKPADVKEKDKPKPDPAAPKPRAKAAAKKPAAKKAGGKKPAAKKPSAAKKPAPKKAAAPKKPGAASETRAPAAETPGVVAEETDGLDAATDRAVAAKEDLERRRRGPLALAGNPAGEHFSPGFASSPKVRIKPVRCGYEDVPMSSKWLGLGETREQGECPDGTSGCDRV